MRRSHALAGAAVALALGTAVDPRLAFPAAIAATLVAVALPRRWAPEAGGRVAFAAGAWVIAARVFAGGMLPTTSGYVSLQAAGQEWSATVESVIRRAGGRQDVVLGGAPAGLIYARLPRYPEFVPGDQVAVEGRLEPLPDLPPSGSEGWVAYLRRIGVAATVEAHSTRLEGRGSDVAAWLARMRGQAGDLIAAALPEPQAGLAAGILVGLRERVDPRVARDFTSAGLSHVVAISGWNIAIVAGMCGALTRRVSRRWRSAIIGAAVGGYAVAAGASPSVVRAALMTGIALLAHEGGRRAGGSRALALAVALMLALDPGSILDPGFQLSAVATGGLITWAAPFAHRLARSVPRLPGFIRETLAVSLAAQIATLPLIVLDFGRLSLVAPLANLAAAPLVPFVMAGAALALPLGALLAMGVAPVAVSGPLAFAALPVTALILVARLAASVPFASVTLPGPVTLPAAAIGLLAVLIVARAHRRASARSAISP